MSDKPKHFIRKPHKNKWKTYPEIVALAFSDKWEMSKTLKSVYKQQSKVLVCRA